MSTSQRIARPVLVVLIACASLSAWLHPSAATAAVCTIGETHPPNVTVNTLDLQGFDAYQLLDPAECPTCTGGSLLLESVSWRFKYFVDPCPIVFQVSILPVIPGPCLRPDTTEALCGPVDYIYLPTGDLSPTITIPLPSGCCISGPAFVQVRITNTGGCVPGYIGFFAYSPGTCTPCRSYATSPPYLLQDSCTLLGVTPTITVAADCCPPTPTRRQSWGQVKQIYR